MDKKDLNLNERDTLGSRLGFILLSAGCAIGLGNVWKFPYMVGQNGGALFVLIYIAFLLMFGIPVMTMEFSIGRAARKSPAKMYEPLEPKGTKWHFHSYAALMGNVLLMMFYTTVAGWIISYFFKSAAGSFDGVGTREVASEFGNMLASPLEQILFMAITVVLGTLVCSLGVKKSLERVTKVMMVALLALMVVVAVNGFTLNGARDGLKFYLIPNFDELSASDVFSIIVSAMSQAFFTLSIGIGSMAIFGSYIDKGRSLLGESITIAAVDTFVAFVSGLIIFPACFTYNNGEVGAGPPLIFETLPNVFANMPLGRLWGSLFFIFLSFAALSTVFAVFENIIACIMDMTGLGRIRSSLICGGGILVLSVPCILGYNLWSSFHPFGENSSVLDLEDFIVSNLLLPIGSLIFVLFCTSRRGWGWDNFINEANTGKGLKIRAWMRVYMKYVLPVLLFIFCIINIVTFFISK